MALTRVRNNQIYNSDINAASKIQAGSIIGSLFNANISHTGNISSGNISASDVIQANIHTGVAVYAATIGNTGTTLAGTLSTPTQNSITSLVGLTSFGTSNVTTTATGNFTIVGNLTVQGNTSTIGSSDLVVQDSIINLHTYANLVAWTSNDGRDIGIKFHYYDTADKHAFLGRDNATGFLEFFANGTENSSNVFTGTDYGTIKAGALLAANTTASTSTATGALQVSGGAGIAGAVYANNFNGVSVYAGTIGNTGATLTGATLTTTGNITAGGNINITGNITPSANVTYSLGTPTLRFKNLYLSGNTIDLDGVTISSTTAGGIVVTSLVSNASVQGNTFAGIAVYGATIGNTGAALSGATAALTGAVTGNTFTGIAVYGGTIGNTGSTLTGTLSTTAQTNITSLGTLTSLGVTGTSTLGVVTAASVSAGTIGNSGATINGTLGTAAQTNITSVGTLSSLNSSGNITAQTANVYAGNLVANTAVYSNNYYYSNGTAFSSGSGGFTNGQSITVGNLTISGNVTAGGSTGTAGQALISTGTGVQWGATSPGYNYSSQFNGSNALSIPNNALFNFGSGAFTVEGWFYIRSIPGGSNYSSIVSNYGTSTTGWSIQLSPTGAFGISLSGDGSDITGSTVVGLNAWHHIALSGSSGSIKFFLDGVQEGSTYTGAVSLDSSAQLTIGGLYFNGLISTSYFTGFISNLRIIKGTTLYTSNFTVPTTALSAVSGTSLLTCNAITPTSDSSTNNLAITNTGAVTTTATQSPFTSTTVSIPTASLTAVRQQFTGDGSTTQFNIAGGYTPNSISVFVNGVLARNGSDVIVTSGSYITFTAITPPNNSLIDVIGTVPTTYSSITPVSYSVGFNGSNRYLSIASTTALTNWYSSNFTIEYWINPTAFSQGSNGESNVLGNMTYNSSGTYWSFGPISAGTVKFYYYNGSAQSITTTATIPLNQWTHLAFVNIGNSLTIYINGVSSATGTISGTPQSGGAINLTVGASNSVYFNGYISNLRLVSGLGVYTGAFTPPQTPLAAVQSATNPSIQAITGTQTSLLTCNGPTIIDGSTNAFTITNNGTAPVSTAIVPTFTNVTINNTSGGGVLQVQSTYYTSATQLTSSGAMHELTSNLRVSITPKSATSTIMIEVYATFVSPGSNNLEYAAIYDVTNSAYVNLPPANGSRTRVHWVQRTTAFDANDFDTMSFTISVPNTSTATRTYTLYHSTEGSVIQFLSSTLSTASGATYPMFMRVWEIAP